jgi:hypothetical protein
MKVTQGDNNMKYFHLLANSRHMKTQIIQLEQEEAGYNCRGRQP